MGPTRRWWTIEDSKTSGLPRVNLSYPGPATKGGRDVDRDQLTVSELRGASRRLPDSQIEPRIRAADQGRGSCPSVRHHLARLQVSFVRPLTGIGLHASLRHRAKGAQCPTTQPNRASSTQASLVGSESSANSSPLSTAPSRARGRARLVMGEPGIGKTSLCEQLAAYVSAKDGKTLVGHCYEEGSLSLPYLAFVEVMRSYVLDRDIDSLKGELGQGVVDVARIVPAVGELLQIEPSQAGGAEDDRYRLLQAVASFLRNASETRPMVLLLEDLHDADKGTLDILTYFSRNLAGARLLVVGTYRDVEVDRAHPLSGTLAELRRASTFSRIALSPHFPDQPRGCVVIR